MQTFNCSLYFTPFKCNNGFSTRFCKTQEGVRNGFQYTLAMLMKHTVYRLTRKFTLTSATSSLDSLWRHNLNAPDMDDSPERNQGTHMSRDIATSHISVGQTAGGVLRILSLKVCPVILKKKTLLYAPNRKCYNDSSNFCHHLQKSRTWKADKRYDYCIEFCFQKVNASEPGAI